MKYNSQKIVFFGPFVGEFGWEVCYWQGWVKRLCRTRYKNYRKIACSFPGRYPFYPEVDEFLPLPEEFLKIPISSRNYITDCWLQGRPEADVLGNFQDVWPRLEKVIADFKEKLPENTEFIFPWQHRYDPEDGRYYGVDKNFTAHSIPYSKQVLEKLQPTKEGKEALKRIVGPEEKLIAIFPRGRMFRRPGVNWEKEKYQALIDLIKTGLPEYKIAILGEPQGAFFADSVPEGCLDLINVEKDKRADLHLAALERAAIALGGRSGAPSFAANAGAKVLTWAEAPIERVYANENYLKQSSWLFLPDINPDAEYVFKYLKWLLGKGPMPGDNFFRIMKIAFWRIFNPRYFRFLKSGLKRIKL